MFLICSMWAGVRSLICIGSGNGRDYKKSLDNELSAIVCYCESGSISATVMSGVEFPGRMARPPSDSVTAARRKWSYDGSFDVAVIAAFEECEAAIPRLLFYEQI